MQPLTPKLQVKRAAWFLVTAVCLMAALQAGCALPDIGAGQGYEHAASAADAVGSGLWGRRSGWEVTVDAEGVYRGYHVREASEERLIITVSETRRERPDWKAWLVDGSENARSRITYVVSLPDGSVMARYDHIEGKRMPLPAGGMHFAGEGRSIARGEGVYAPGRLLIEEFAARPRIWTGLYTRQREVSTDICPATVGQAPYALGVGSFVEKAGMQVGDILVRLWPWPYDDPVYESYNTLNQAVRDRFQAGDPARVEYLRVDDGECELVQKTVKWPANPIMDIEPDADMLQFVERFVPDEDPPEKKLLDLMAEQAGVSADNRKLMRQLADLHAVTDPYRLPAVIAAHKHPFLAESVARYYLDGIPEPAPSALAGQVSWLYDVYAISPEAGREAEEKQIRDYRGGGLEEHLDHIEDLLALAAHYNRRAFRAFSEEEMQFIKDAAEGLLEGFVSSPMMCFDRDLERQRNNIKLIDMARRLDMPALVRQAETAARIVDGEFLDSLKERMEAARNPRGRIAGRRTQWGEILLDGTADNRYLRGAPAVLVNLGGDNFYANNTGSSVPGELPTAVLVDFDGDDRYENWEPMRQGCGFMGVGILLDFGGDDTFIGNRLVQGAGLFGIGVLMNLQGDDVYRAVDYGQGVGQFGAGFLLDAAGNNRYEGHLACQGVGFTAGLGLLYSADPNGNDFFYNKGLHPSAYRDAGSFSGWGQGVGIGHRPYASGGIGMLVSEGGDDRLEGGTFSLGGGYFYGMGILNNRAGNDRYRGTRYSMGFTAHQAVGVFLEDDGDDHYYSSHYVTLGMAWDESVTVFIDRAGDDVYSAPSFAFGAGTENSFAMFIDGGGSDRFFGPVPGSAHRNHYRGGTSIGYFLALGEAQNEFRGRESGEIAFAPEHAFFLSSASVEDALESLRKRPLTDRDDR